MSNRTRKKEVTPAGLIRWSGAFSIAAGILYVAIQFIHPPEELSSVGSVSWLAVAALTMAMSACSLIGMTGIYARQVTESGWLGLAGFLAFGLFWLASTAFSFVETFVLPLLANHAPQYVEGFLGLFGEAESKVDLGALPLLTAVAGMLYLLGGLLLGAATYRAGVLPRPAGALLAAGAVATLAAAVIPHPFDRVLAVPTGLAFIWLGYALWLPRGGRT